MLGQREVFLLVAIAAVDSTKVNTSCLHVFHKIACSNMSKKSCLVCCGLRCMRLSCMLPGPPTLWSRCPFSEWASLNAFFGKSCGYVTVLIAFHQSCVSPNTRYTLLTYIIQPRFSTDIIEESRVILHSLKSNYHNFGDKGPSRSGFRPGWESNRGLAVKRQQKKQRNDATGIYCSCAWQETRPPLHIHECWSELRDISKSNFVSHIYFIWSFIEMIMRVVWLANNFNAKVCS
jgi:hypothetical protein